MKRSRPNTVSANWYTNNLEITEALSFKNLNILDLSLVMWRKVFCRSLVLFYFIKINKASILLKVYILYIKNFKKNGILFIDGYSPARRTVWELILN